MDKADLQKVKFLLGGLILFIVFLAASQLVLPENCYTHEWRQVGLLCDGIDLRNPQSCTACGDESKALTARILFISGVCFLILPFVVFAVQARRRLPIEQTKLFD
jgi:preprotein translocase subunit SecY